VEYSWGVAGPPDHLLWVRYQPEGSQRFECGRIDSSENGVVLHTVPRHTALGLSAEKVAFRSAQLPFRKSEQILQVLPQEAEESLIEKREKPQFAFTQSHHSNGEGDPLTAIFYAVAEQEQLQQQVDEIEKRGVRGHAYLIAEAGCWPLLQQSGLISEHENILIVDGSATPPTLLSVEQGSLCGVRAVAPASCSRGAASVREELQWLIRSQFRHGGPVDCLVVLNGDEQLVWPTEISSVGKRLEPQLDELADDLDSWEYLRPAGLAIVMQASAKEQRKQLLDFRSGALAGEINWKEWLRPWKAAAVVLLMVAVVAVVQEGARYSVLQERTQTVSNTIKTLFQTTLPNVPMVDPLAQIRQAYQRISGSGEEKPSRRLGQWIALIQTTIPSETKVQWKQLQFEQGQLQLVGEVPSYDHLDKVQAALKEAEGVVEVVMEKAQILTKSRHVQFNLKVL